MPAQERDKMVETAAADRATIAAENAALLRNLLDPFEDPKRFQDHLVRQQKMAALGRLASAMAHELNSPLAVVAGLAEMLLEQVNAPPLAGLPGLAEFPRQLRQIADQALRCGNLVSRLLTYARQRAPQVKPVDLWQVAEDTLALMGGPIRSLGCRFQAVPGPGPLEVVGDPTMLQDAITTLLINALDAVEGGGTVRLVARREEDKPGEARAVLEVADTGMGIAPEVLPRIFEPFFTTKAPDRGAGMGLTICLGIVKQHAGTLVVESPGPGHGATATVRLLAAA
jgi:two-component system NtrC family sensor kinase